MISASLNSPGPIHAHPNFTVILSLAGIKLSTKVLPEISTIFGNDIPVADYATPGTAQMGSVLIPLLRTSQVVIQQRHGLFSTGGTLHDAWYKAEQIESCAKLLCYARLLGDIPILRDQSSQIGLVQARLPSRWTTRR